MSPETAMRLNIFEAALRFAIQKDLTPTAGAEARAIAWTKVQRARVDLEAAIREEIEKAPAA